MYMYMHMYMYVYMYVYMYMRRVAAWRGAARHGTLRHSTCSDAQWIMNTSTSCGQSDQADTKSESEQAS